MRSAPVEEYLVANPEVGIPSSWDHTYRLLNPPFVLARKLWLTRLTRH